MNGHQYERIMNLLERICAAVEKPSPFGTLDECASPRTAVVRPDPEQPPRGPKRGRGGK